MIDLTEIVEAVLALAVTIISVFVIPWIKSKTTAQERENLLRWVDIAVAAAQQLYHQSDGERRLAYALDVLADKGFDVDNMAVRDAVEAAVLKLHRQLEGKEDDG